MTLAHEINGSGPTLVLVHGITHRRQGWDPLLEYLTPHRRVVTVDLPGHGESPMPEPEADVIAQVIGDVSEFVKEVTPAGEQAHIAGNSLGGLLALALAARGEVASATALSPAGFFVNKLDQRRAIAMFTAVRAMARMGGENLPNMLKYKVFRYPGLLPFFAHPSRISYETALIDSRSLLASELIDIAEDIELKWSDVDSTVPVTVAWGRRDMVLPIYQARKVNEIFPQARVKKIRGVGHVPMSDAPELISSIILAGSESSSAR